MKPLNDYWVRKASVSDCVGKAFNKIVMWQSTDDIDHLKSALGFLGNAIQIAQKAEE